MDLIGTKKENEERLILLIFGGFAFFVICLVYGVLVPGEYWRMIEGVGMGLTAFVFGVICIPDGKP